ncbi:oxaloacetate tautomerase FAHD1, mitochondrial-like isoform 2-T2 [Anomaloglossus baeobatrachus]|uniref:oxaloacetate tautomerase FAHD1, mitochondrial-like isoform X2 n=1 Tax=Anomaloglossus baeobatrachus TaxID=238106 RepID=UPI003F5093D7
MCTVMDRELYKRTTPITVMEVSTSHGVCVWTVPLCILCGGVRLTGGSVLYCTLYCSHILAGLIIHRLWCGDSSTPSSTSPLIHFLFLHVQWTFHPSPKRIPCPNMASSKNLTRFWEWGRKIICVGRNYTEHAKELKNAVPTEPVLFLKTPSAYVREGAPILMPYYTDNLHHEVELGVVIGRGGKDINQSSAMDHVEGYALCLDMTARDVQDQCKQKGLPWTLAKAFDTSCPISDLISKDTIKDPHNVNIWLKVNDVLRQEGSTSSMIFSIPFLISYISRVITLEEGDLILTGTPKGVAAVQENDEMVAGIDDIISMRFQIKKQS